ncbi:hypothetical protein XH99_12095 [Bradyrhizobium nanningense]|uniref:Uncharacterized protein n=1 Tax=Bradyrhizobium nanningense TaxID=1325118 RepID=A0A4Q0S7E6_9BRAD|nr:hypothetical protein XH99_12095 [Bradyrhizobium nanningense]
MPRRTGFPAFAGNDSGVRGIVLRITIARTISSHQHRSPHPPFHQSKNGIDRYCLELGHFAALASRSRLEEMFEF